MALNTAEPGAGQPATDPRVERVAKWMHNYFRRLSRAKDPGCAVKTWEQLSDATKWYYRAVARALIESPPPGLVSAIKGAGKKGSGKGGQ